MKAGAAPLHPASHNHMYTRGPLVNAFTPALDQNHQDDHEANAGNHPNQCDVIHVVFLLSSFHSM